MITIKLNPKDDCVYQNRTQVVLNQIVLSKKIYDELIKLQSSNLFEIVSIDYNNELCTPLEDVFAHVDIKPIN